MGCDFPLIAMERSCGNLGVCICSYTLDSFAISDCENMRYDFPMIVPIVFVTMFAKLERVIDSMRTWVLCWIWGVSRGSHTRFEGETIIRTRRKGEICLEDGVVINARIRNNLVGITNPTIIDTRLGGRLMIGNQSGLTSPLISTKTSITIGRNVKIGGNVRIFDHDFHALEWNNRRTPENRGAVRSKPIVIEDDVFVGTNAILLKGTHLGARSIVAAGSVVFGLDVPPNSLVKGNPAIIIQKKGEC